MTLLRLFGLTLLVAGLAQALGALAVVGAFLVGIAVPSTFAEGARAILAPSPDLFAATFFVAFGLGADPAAVLPAVARAGSDLITIKTKLATGYMLVLAVAGPVLARFIEPLSAGIVRALPSSTCR